MITIHQRHRQTERQTTCDRNTALCTKVHRAVKTVCTLMHGVVYGHAPQYLSDMMVHVSQFAGRSHLRSAHRGAYDTPRIRTTFGSRSFSFATPYMYAWNHLPADIRAISTVSTFKQHLKTYLFNIAYFY